MLKKTYKKILAPKRLSPILFLGLALTCLYPVRNNEILEQDTQFLFLPANEYTREKVEEVTSPWQAKSHRGKAILGPDRNNLGILFLRNSLLDDAETEFLEAQKLLPSNPVPSLNLLRLYYLVDDISEAKKFLSSYLKQAPPVERKKFENLLLETDREEELVIFRDALSSIPGQELGAWEGLAEYFFSKQDWPKSYFYLEKILQQSPYHKNGRGLMLRIAHILEKWDDVLVFGNSLSATGERIPELEYYMAHAYFEKRRYAEALTWIGKAPESERESIVFLELWKNALLAKSPKGDVSALLPYFKRLQTKGLQIPEEEFFPTTTPEGKEAMDRIFWGH
ncbi:tetratricopeptide repeat protein [Leptospira wolffii]|uniref:Tetratricopeptide repeat protein n=1 Tax=Leptospira wolffii TaxID=409998 RepID=A0ABV5BI59_9LEPT